ncbi:hypothetical protein SADUNF_Sadunf03G0063600 [Salix dunnii]|uniref:Uncharacterized protein n=1 Tax=Salix dunnii TaxID=1413687 RepID=A0A835KDC6_9ROSI|nr:hypothetical protein SADUNF_Sadunf03G0063600 [Salix dunnii]
MLVFMADYIETIGGRATILFTTITTDFLPERKARSSMIIKAGTSGFSDEEDRMVEMKKWGPTIGFFMADGI